MLRTIALSLAVLLSYIASTSAGLTVVRCDPPDGYRIQYAGDGLLGDGPAKLTTGRDNFSEVNPVFIFDDLDAKTVKIIWGGSVPEGITREQVESLNPAQSKSGFVAYASENQTTLVELAANGVWVHSFYPQWRLGIFTRQTNGTIDRSALGSIFAAICTFTRVE